MATVDVLRVVNLVFGAAAAGAAVYEAAVVFPTARSGPIARRVELLRALRMSPHRSGYRYLPLSGIASIAAAVALVALWTRQPQSADLLTAIGLGLFVGAAAMNYAYWQFAEKRLYQPASPADDVVPSLESRNAARTVFYTLGFTAFAIAAAVN